MDGQEAPNRPRVSYRSVEGVGVIELDDGKANALSYAVIDEFQRALSAALAADDAVVITGRPGVFSAGFDLAEVRRGPAEAAAIIEAGSSLIGQIFASPKPVVSACSGHAVAGGAVILLVSDVRIASAGPWSIGLNEVAIGIGLPEFVVRVGQYRLARTRCERLLLGEMCDPEGAVAAGYLDALVPPEVLMDSAIAAARGLASRDRRAYAVTKAAARRGLESASWRPQ